MSELDSAPVEMTEAPDPVVESTPDVSVDESTPVETDAAPVEGEQPPVEESAPDELELDDPYDGTPDKISDDQKQYFYRAGKAKQMMAALDFQRKIDQAIPGATIQDLQTAHNRAVIHAQMREDFHSEDPDRFNTWLDHHINPDSEWAPSIQSVAMLADGLLNKLPQHYPQVYDRVRSSVMTGEIDRLYSEAVQTGDEALMKLAQNLDFKATGKFKKATEVGRRDPLAEREAELARREKEWQSRSAQDRQAQVQQFMANTDIAQNDAVASEIESLLTKDANGNPIAHMVGLKGSPDWDFTVHQINQKVAEARKASPSWDREYNLLRARATQRPSAESRQAVVDKMRSLVSSVVRANRKGWISQLSTKTLSASAQAQAKAQAGAIKREPSGGGKAVNPTGTLAQRAKQIVASGVGDPMDEIAKLWSS